MHVPDPHSVAAHAQLTGSQPAGVGSHEKWASGQPAMQPDGPASGQLGVATDPAGQMPPSGTGLHVSAPQFCTPRHSSPTGQTASPQVVGPASLAADDLQPAKASRASSAYPSHRPRIEEMLSRRGRGLAKVDFQLVSCRRQVRWSTLSA
jgi:hypothetical protein